MMKKSVEERRGSIRAKRVLSIYYKVSKSRRKISDTTWKLSTTEDMSVGGLSFYADQEMRVGDTIELQVIMSGILDIYKGFGKVVRVIRKKTGAYYLIAIKLLNKKNVNSRSAKKHSESRARIKK